MRKMEITEIDSECYHIETNDFHDDSIQYTWSVTPGHFYAEHKRTFKRHYFDWKPFSNFGDAVKHIWSLERNRNNEVYTKLRY